MPNTPENLLMQTYLSFQPRYHELTCRDSRSVWVPMYNPIREVVQAERQRIEGEFGNVDSTAWVRPAKKKADIKEVWSDVAYVAKFLVGSMLLGWLMHSIPFVNRWLVHAPHDNSVAAMMVTGAVTLSLCGLVVGPSRLKIARRRAAEAQKPQESQHAQ